MFPCQLTNKLYLDFFKIEDSSELYQLIDDNRSYLREFLPWLDLCTSVENSISFIKKVRADNEERKALTLCIRDTGKIIGAICFHPFDIIENSAGIGYWIDEKHQGRGIITEACKLLISYGFQELKLSVIKISCNVANTKSRSIPNSLGFTSTQIIANKEWLYDHFVDHCCYFINREEWIALHSKK